MNKKLTLLILLAALCGCSAAPASSTAAAATETPSAAAPVPSPTPESFAEIPDLTVRFGREGEPFTMKMEDNETAVQIVRYVGQSDWNLPIYHYDDFEDAEVMQYYDIPSRYVISSDPQTITSEQAGEVYYSEPNRILLFYRDAEITAPMVLIGRFDATEEWAEAVESNPVQEGWGNKIISLSRE